MAMTLVRWDPFRELVTMSDRLNRMLAEPSALEREGEPYGAWVPPVDIFERDDTLYIRAELPGMRKEDIDLRIENGVLTISGNRLRDEMLAQATSHRLERLHGSFTRSFTLPTTVDAGRIAASYRDGILEVQLPKSEASKPKRVDIRTV